jgi:hypothetical protein
MYLPVCLFCLIYCGTRSETGSYPCHHLLLPPEETPPVPPLTAPTNHCPDYAKFPSARYLPLDHSYGISIWILSSENYACVRNKYSNDYTTELHYLLITILTVSLFVTPTCRTSLTNLVPINTSLCDYYRLAAWLSHLWHCLLRKDQTQLSILRDYNSVDGSLPSLGIPCVSDHWRCYLTLFCPKATIWLPKGTSPKRSSNHCCQSSK